MEQLTDNAFWEKQEITRICRALVFYPFKILFRILRWNTKYFAPYLVIKASMN